MALTPVTKIEVVVADGPKADVVLAWNIHGSPTDWLEAMTTGEDPDIAA